MAVTLQTANVSTIVSSKPFRLVCDAQVHPADVVQAQLKALRESDLATVYVLTD